MTQQRKYITIDEFNAYKEESRKSRQNIYEKLGDIEKSIPDGVHDGMEKYLTNGGSTIISNAAETGVKSTLGGIGLPVDTPEHQLETIKHIDNMKERNKQTKWFKDKVFLTLIAIGTGYFANDVIPKLFGGS